MTTKKKGPRDYGSCAICGQAISGACAGHTTCGKSSCVRSYRAIVNDALDGDDDSLQELSFGE